jgi:streptomycin 6-kinase
MRLIFGARCASTSGTTTTTEPTDHSLRPHPCEPCLSPLDSPRSNAWGYDTITVIGSHYWRLLAEADPESALLRCIAVFADAAEIDRARRWTQARAVTASLWGRQHGDHHWWIDANDQCAELLA